jgi:hypothetical protein
MSLIGLLQVGPWRRQADRAVILHLQEYFFDVGENTRSSFRWIEAARGTAEGVIAAAGTSPR